MAPLRSNRARERAQRGAQIDHDIMDGLPVRQWRRRSSMVTTETPEEVNAANSKRPERKDLPMPTGSEMYTPWCQALLRAARMGLFKRPAALATEDEEKTGYDADPWYEQVNGFKNMHWAQIPREKEEAEFDFLAKRRKGLPPVYDAAAANLLAGPMRKTKVRKVDADGNETVLNVLAPEGTVVEGDIGFDNDIRAHTPAPGTVIEGLGVVNEEGFVITGDLMATPSRQRRPPPPKRKPGPGRGRKKKVILLGEDGLPVAVPAAPQPTDGVVPGLEAGDGASKGPSTGDAEAGDDSEDGEDDAGEDGEEGEEDDDRDKEEGELTPSGNGDATGSSVNTPRYNMQGITIDPPRSVPEVVITTEDTPLVDTVMIEGTDTVLPPEEEHEQPLVMMQRGGELVDVPAAEVEEDTVPNITVPVAPAHEAIEPEQQNDTVMDEPAPVMEQPLVPPVTEQSENISEAASTPLSALEDSEAMGTPLPQNLPSQRARDVAPLPAVVEPIAIEEPFETTITEKQAEPEVVAELPSEQNRLEGLTGPQAREEENKPERFEDGEENLLGTFEKAQAEEKENSKAES